MFNSKIHSEGLKTTNAHETGYNTLFMQDCLSYLQECTK